MAVSRRILLAAIALVVIAAVVVGIVLATRGDAGAPGAAATGGASSEPAATSGATARASSDASASATPKATAGAGGSTGGSATATATPAPGTASGTAQQPTALEGTATVVPKVTAELATLTAVTGKSGGVGEVSGPAIRFTITIANATSKTVDLSSTVVTVTYGDDDTPSNEIATARKNFPSTVKAGATASGTFTFSVPKADRDVRITLDYGVSAPSVVFAGNAPA